MPLVSFLPLIKVTGSIPTSCVYFKQTDNDKKPEHWWLTLPGNVEKSKWKHVWQDKRTLAVNNIFFVIGVSADKVNNKFTVFAKYICGNINYRVLHTCI